MKRVTGEGLFVSIIGEVLMLSLWKGKGQQAVAKVSSMEPLEALLSYLNEDEGVEILHGLRKLLKEECGREIGEYLWVFWHTKGIYGTQHRFLQNIDGIWTENTHELRDCFSPLWEVEIQQAKQQRRNEQQETSSAVEIPVTEEKLDKPQEQNVLAEPLHSNDSQATHDDTEVPLQEPVLEHSDLDTSDVIPPTDKVEDPNQLSLF